MFILIRIKTNKILLNPHLEKGDEEKILPFFKGESEGILKQKKAHHH